eukprot:GHVS01096702.1.p1 GENE.GHVS01096702.1~~GHVS01096702.1.p1  ORF type:complete len:115 (+),score=16.78 GHVS01096702.1:349-693(+)
MRLAATYRNDEDPFHADKAKNDVDSFLSNETAMKKDLAQDFNKAQKVASSNPTSLLPTDVVCGLMRAFNVVGTKESVDTIQYFQNFVEAGLLPHPLTAPMRLHSCCAVRHQFTA